MRIWSLYPGLLDSKALVAGWREALLARNVLLGLTKGYRNHPQLTRFKLAEQPVEAINAYLLELFLESQARGYNFDSSKLDNQATRRQGIIPVNPGQIEYEFRLLQHKLAVRDPIKFQENTGVASIAVNGIFRLVDGPIEAWEKVLPGLL